MTKRMTKAQKAELAAKAAEGATAEPTTTVNTIEVIGDMEALIEALGTVETALEAVNSPAMQDCVALFEVGAEAGAKGEEMQWDNVEVVSYDVDIAGIGRRKIWGMSANKAGVDAYCDQLAAGKKKFRRQSLENALAGFKKLADERTAREANKADRAAAVVASKARVANFSTMNLLLTDGSNSPWRVMSSIALADLPEILISKMAPVGGEKDPQMQECLGKAAESVLAFASELQAAFATMGDLKTFADCRSAFEQVSAVWRTAEKVPPFVMGLRLVTRLFKGESFGCIVHGDDVRQFVDEMARQFDARQAELKAMFEKKNKPFTMARKPQVDVKDPVYGILSFLLYFGPKEAEKLAEFETKEAAKVAEGARAVEGLKVGFGALLQKRYGVGSDSVVDIIEAATSWKPKKVKREKGDRHRRDDN